MRNLARPISSGAKRGVFPCVPVFTGVIDKYSNRSDRNNNYDVISRGFIDFREFFIDGFFLKKKKRKKERTSTRKKARINYSYSREI